MKKMISNDKKIAFILTCLLALIALGSLLWILTRGQLFTGHNDASMHTSPSGSALNEHLIADIYQNGELIQSIFLNDVDSTYTFVVVGENNCHNEIEVRPGSIGMISADCPDKLCVHQGFISSSLLPITCLPNHLVVQIRMEDTATNSDTPVDVITY